MGGVSKLTFPSTPTLWIWCSNLISPLLLNLVTLPPWLSAQLWMLLGNHLLLTARTSLLSVHCYTWQPALGLILLFLSVTFLGFLLFLLFSLNTSGVAGQFAAAALKYLKKTKINLISSRPRQRRSRGGLGSILKEAG